MELFIKTIFWIATLHSFLHAFSASPLPFPCIDLQTKEMQTNVKCPSDTELYTPENVEDKCIHTALDCIRTELNGTLRSECDDKFGYINQTVDALDRMINKAEVKNTECPCEGWDTTPFGNFLKKIDDLCHRRNSRFGS